MSGHEPLVPLPAEGRRFSAERRVRWGDADHHALLRLDAAARFLQDVSNDDTRDAGFDPDAPWVVRRTVLEILQPCRLGEVVTLTTWNGGSGSRWAERRTTVRGDAGGHLEAASLWVYVDPVSGRPARLDPAFHQVYDEAAGGRTVKARLHHGEVAEGAEVRTWPLRATDLDRLNHVNNAATWEAIVDEAARRDFVVGRAELEYPDAIAPGAAVHLHAQEGEEQLLVWLVVDEVVRASAVLDRLR